MLGEYSYKPKTGGIKGALEDASWAFNGGMNSHTRTARARMRALRIARFVE
jgi:stearoyl-CoA desaturase (delta-9 desaturase)